MKHVRFHREKFATEAAWLRYRRRVYVSRLANWLEADRERVYDLALRMTKNGLYAASTGEVFSRCGILTILAKVQGYETPRLRRQWLLKSGWSPYWGWYGSRKQRAKAGAA